MRLAYTWQKLNSQILTYEGGMVGMCNLLKRQKIPKYKAYTPLIRSGLTVEFF